MKNRLIFVFSVVGVILSIDLIANYFFNFYYVVLNKKLIIDVVYLLILVTLTSFSFRILRIGIVIFLFTLILIGIVHYKFFHNQLLPFEWHLVFVSFSDVLNALYNNLMLVIGFLLLYLVFIYIFIKLAKKILNNKKYELFSCLGIIILLLLPTLDKKRITTFLPSNKHLTYFNVLFSLERTIYQSIFEKTNIDFKKYKFPKINEGKQVVVLVIGESLNYKRMHMYGWNVEDTPLLEKFAKNNSNFIYKKAIASAPETTTSIASFMYIKREPRNIKVLSQKNLIELAKNNGYKVIWISMQEDRGNLLPKFVNESDVSFIRKYFNKKYDDKLLKKLKSLKLSGKLFIILHFMANHYYYETYTPKSFYKFDFDKNKLTYHQYMVNSYMNSVLYIDKVLYDILNYFKNYKNFSLYFTSDHGEMLGFPEEKGRYLHLILTKYDTFVPFFYFSDKKDKNLTLPYYPHYEIAKMVAQDLGYKVINPNEKKDIYYINAPQFDGSAGFIEYNLSKWNDK